MRATLSIITVNAVFIACTLAKFGLSWQELAALALTEYLFILAVIDSYTGLLPDFLTLSLLWLGLLINIFHVFTDIKSAVMGAVLGYVSLWLVFWLFKSQTGKEGMGYGDFKLLAALGAWLGWQVLPAIVFLACFISLVAVLLYRVHSKTWQVSIPFGPGLALAAWLILVVSSYFSALFS